MDKTPVSQLGEPTPLNKKDDPRRRSVASDGIKVEYFVFGSGPETLLMIPGNGRWADDLAGIASAIAVAGFSVVTINHRGIGGSEGPLEKATLHDLASDVWRVADDLKLTNVHLAGKTYGQRIMRTASADQPDRVLSLITMGCGGEFLPSEEVQNAYRRMNEPDIGREEWVKLNAFANFARANADKSKLGFGGSYPEVGNLQLAITNRTPLDEWWQGGTAPMLVIQGLEDKVAVPQNAFNVATKRPRTWLAGIPNCGHNMVFEQPDEVAEHIVAFLKRLGCLDGIRRVAVAD
jgi:pimeloyl-ACP methyl ester carboxylesterase